MAVDDADFPLAREPIPNLKRDRCAESEPAKAEDDEELSHVPDIRVAGEFGAPPHKNEPGEVTTGLDEKRMAIALCPIQGEVLVAESPVRTEFQVDTLAEVVRVQLEQVGQDRLLFRRGRDDLHGQRRIHSGDGHRRHVNYAQRASPVYLSISIGGDGIVTGCDLS